MKRIILFLFVVLMTLTSFSQNEENIRNVNPQMIFSPVSYRLFPTENNWIFIKLNTRNGKMWMIQYDLQGDNRLVVFLNSLSLVDKEKELDGRFTLYPTKNIWTFILLDQYNGKTWQVQWSTEPDERLILPIE